MSVRQLKDEFNRILEDRQKEKQVRSSRMEEQYKRWRSVSQKYTHEIKSALKKQNIDIDMIRAVRPKFEGNDQKFVSPPLGQTSLLRLQSNTNWIRYPTSQAFQG
jgi:hypothetical protein